MRHLPIALEVGDPAAVDVEITGAKAANLARCAVAKLPVVDGFVLTTTGAARGLHDNEVLGELGRRWRTITEDGRLALVVRSSSVAEDAEASSLAGQFTSVLDVQRQLDATGEGCCSASIPWKETPDAWSWTWCPLVPTRS